MVGTGPFVENGINRFQRVFIIVYHDDSHIDEDISFENDKLGYLWNNGVIEEVDNDVDLSLG